MVLREVVNDLVGLFGTTAGGAMLRTDIERLSLPGYQRRALVLAASELVINALSHAFGERRDGWLLVSLRRADGQVRLVVADDGIRCDIGPEQAERVVAGSMAALLEAVSSIVRRKKGEHGPRLGSLILGASAESIALNCWGPTVPIASRSGLAAAAAKLTAGALPSLSCS